MPSNFLLLCGVISALLVISCAQQHDDYEGYTFERYLADFPKNYTADEHERHQAIFERALQEIRTFNREDKPYKLGVNVFTDMTDEEKLRFKGLYTRSFLDLAAVEPPSEFYSSLERVEALPKEVDWRDKKVVTPTKNQGGCGSCWAFSATEVLESHVAIKTGKLMVLAPQQLVSCAPNPDDCGGTGGCGGSTQWLGMNYTIAAGGLSLESSYPYTEDNSPCDKNQIKPVAGITGYVRLPANNYTVLMNAVAKLGPVAISLDASFMGYRKGVYVGSCGPTIDHAVVLVGYGTDAVGGDYYLVRNSWGEGWGEGGYIRLKRTDKDSDVCAINKQPSSGTVCKPYPKTQKVCGICGILSDSSYPTGGHLVN